MTALSSATVGRVGAVTDCKAFIHTPADTAANILTDGTKKYGVKTRNIVGGLRVLWFPSAVTTGCTKVEIIAAADLAGTSAQVIKDKTVTVDAVMESSSLEITADEINLAEQAAGVALPWVTVKLTCGNTSDRIVVVFVTSPTRWSGTPGTDTWIGGLPAYNTDYTV